MPKQFDGALFKFKCYIKLKKAFEKPAIFQTPLERDMRVVYQIFSKL